MTLKIHILRVHSNVTMKIAPHCVVEVKDGDLLWLDVPSKPHAVTGLVQGRLNLVCEAAVRGV